MRTGMCVALFAAAAMLWLVGPSAAQAQEQETGNVTGKVVDAEGNAVAEAQVRLIVPPQRPARQRDQQAVEREALPLQDAPEGRPGRGDRPARPEPVATATTDANGQFTMNNVPVGQYLAVAGVRGTGMGRAPVTVQAGETAEVTITLSPPREGGPAPADGERPRRGRE